MPPCRSLLLPLALTCLLTVALGDTLGTTRAASAADEATEAVTALKRALRRGAPDERREAVHRIGRVAGRLPTARRRSAAVTIAKALPDEGDAEVRREMVKSLARLGGPTGWIPVVVAWFSSTDADVKAVARQAVLWGGSDYLAVVDRLMKEDKDPTFRARIALLLGDRRKRDAVPLLLTRLQQDGHPRVESAAAEALEAITGQSFGYDGEAWAAWWNRESAKADSARGADTGSETVTVAEEEPPEIPEPPRHVTTSLVPTFYGLPLTAKDIVFVLDISGSVGAGGVGRAKKELVRAVEHLGSDVHVSALFFDDKVHMWKPEMVPASPANKAELSHFLRGIEPGKRTDVFTPLNAGIQIVRRRVAQLKEAGGPIREAVTLIVVSDGVETQKGTPSHIVEDKLARLDPAHTVVHAVALGSKVSRLMRELARRGGGHYVQAR